MNAPAIPDVGQEGPDFKLKGPGGAFYTLSEYRGERPVVLVFYPLAFSPVCTHQLPELQAQMARFEALGAQVFGISVDSHWSNSAFAQSLGLSFPLLSDFRHEASTAYGMFLPEALISGRAIFVVGRDGGILHREVSEDRGDLEQIPSVERALAALGG